MARFDRVGHRITGDRRQGCCPGAGYEKGPTTVGFLSRAVAWFNGQGIECRRVLSDNGSAYQSHGWRTAAKAMGWTVKTTRPYTPRTHGKAQRFIQPQASA